MLNRDRGELPSLTEQLEEPSRALHHLKDTFVGIRNESGKFKLPGRDETGHLVSAQALGW